MNLNSRASIRRLNAIGLALLYDAAMFVGTLLLLASGILVDREWLYYPVVFLCMVPLSFGWLLSALHLLGSPADDAQKTASWLRLLFAGPFGPGWYLSNLKIE